jgi:hypothetical protein
MPAEREITDLEFNVLETIIEISVVFGVGSKQKQLIQVRRSLILKQEMEGGLKGKDTLSDLLPERYGHHDRH